MIFKPDGIGARARQIEHHRNGDQPIFDAAGSLACVVNGEFYGYEKIRQRLLREGRRFSTESDSKIALHLYDTMGAGATSFSQTGGTVQATPTSATKRSQRGLALTCSAAAQPTTTHPNSH